MVAWLDSLTHRIDKALYVRGFAAAPLRRLMRSQIFVALACTATVVLSPWLGMWPVDFALGAVLATYNLYALSRFVQQMVLTTYTRGLLVSLLLRVYGRLLLTGLTLYVLIRWGQSSVPALVIGLSTVAATILIWGLAQRFEHNVKEA